MKKIFLKCFLFCLTFLVVSSVSYADIVVPKTLNVQGRITNDSGQPITGKKCTIKLKIGSKEFTVNDVQLDNEGLYNANIGIEDFLETATFEELYKFKVSVQPEGESAIESSENPFAAVPYSFYSSTSAYLDVRGVKLVNENFNQSTTTWTTDNTYNIAVGSASYAKKASEINVDGIKGYVWGIDGTGKQNWVSAGSLSISTASQSVIGGIMLGDDSKDTGLSSAIPDGILKVKPATTSKIGGVKIGNNINVDSNGVISISTATNSVLGVSKVKAENGLSITNGEISIGKADKSNYGTVTIGDNINVNNGVISVDPTKLIIPLATKTSTGTVKVGSNINVSNGEISISTATSDILGVVKVEANNGLSISSGKISLAKASGSSIGTVKVGSNINVADGVISVSTATASKLGVMKLYSSTGTATDGTITRTAITNAITNTIDTKISGKEDKSNRTDSYTETATTKYPSSKALSDGLGTKQATISSLNKLDADLLQDGTTNKVFTSTLKTTYDGYATTIDGKESTTNRTDSYSETATTKYPSSKALSDGLATKQNTIDSSNKLSATLVDGLATVATSGKASDLTNDSNFVTKEVSDLTNYTTTANMNTELGKKQNTIDSSHKLSATLVDGLATVATSGKASDLTNDSNFVVDASYVHTDNNFTTSLKNTYDGYATTISGKQDALSSDQLAATNSGITSTKVSTYDGYSSTLDNHESRISALEGKVTTLEGKVATLEGAGADLAEIYQSTENLVPGDVVSIDTTKDNSIIKTKVAEDTLVAGVISTEPGVLLNKSEKGYKLALVGKVPTKVCNEGGNIKRGDLLVSASIAGYAKKAGDNPKAGTVIGKALQNFDSQKGTILVLVNLQ